MPDKWVRKYSGDERESQTYDETFRIKQVAPYGQDATNEQLVQIAVDSQGGVKTSSGLAIASGNVTGTTFIHKFGNAPDFDTGDAEVTVWDGANDALSGTGTAMDYTYSASADISQLSSTAADSVDIEIQGLDTDWNLVIQTVTLNGTTPVDMTIAGTALRRVFRMKNIGATDLAGTVHLSTAGAALTAGEPDALGDNRAILAIGNNQTLMSIYTVPLGKTAYMRSFYSATSGASRSAEYEVSLFARPFGQVFQLKHRTALQDGGTTYIDHTYVEPEKFSAKTDIVIKTKILTTAITAGAVSAGFDLVLVDD